MKISRILIPAAILTASLFSSCSSNVRISGNVEGLGEDDMLEVKVLDVNTFVTTDTLTTDASGAFSYRMSVPKEEPQFVYLFRNGVKVASLLLFAGDRVMVSADTLGGYTVEGSSQSLLLQEVENAHNEFARDFVRIVASGDGSATAKAYVDYYRKCVAFVMNNPHSLTCIPVLYQQVAENMPVFSQYTDAVHFRRVCDSLKMDYPASRYVKALEKETARRESLLQLSTQMSEARQVGYPDIALPDRNGQKVALSSIDSKVILVHFWSAADAAMKMFNLDVLKPLYDRFHDRGLEIYSVCTDADKASWAAVVKNQDLPWINVCDGLGAASTVLSVYNVTSLPQSYIISSGTLYDRKVSSSKDLEDALGGLLK